MEHPFEINSDHAFLYPVSPLPTLPWYWKSFVVEMKLHKSAISLFIPIFYSSTCLARDMLPGIITSVDGTLYAALVRYKYKKL